MKFFIFSAIVGLAIFIYLPIDFVSVNLEVLDERGKPVEDARVRMGFLGGGPNVSGKRTDSEGKVWALRTATYGVKIYGEKDGYYDSEIRTGYGDQDITMVLKRKRNPIAMYSEKLYVDPPEVDTKIGYDVFKGDYVKPYGKGVVSDFIFTVNHEIKNNLYVEYYLTVDFSNPNDGMVPFYTEHTESDFKSSYKVNQEKFKGKWEFFKVKKGEHSSDSNFDYDRNYYFRVRSKTNDEGVVESAHYGKIYGEFSNIFYYVNPTPNDRNVEFNTAKNLFVDLDYVVFKP